jgi:hypothetical protein
MERLAKEALDCVIWRAFGMPDVILRAPLFLPNSPSVVHFGMVKTFSIESRSENNKL